MEISIKNKAVFLGLYILACILKPISLKYKCLHGPSEALLPHDESPSMIILESPVALAPLGPAGMLQAESCLNHVQLP